MSELGQLDLPDVQVLNMQDESTFGIKLKLELEDAAGKYLLYFPVPSRMPMMTGCWISSCTRAAFMRTRSR